MKLYVIRFWWICIFLCGQFLSNAQEITGDSLRNANKFLEASIAYEYAIYKESDFERRAILMIKKAYAQKELGLFTDAFKGLERVEIYSVSDSLASITLYESALNAYLGGIFDQSLSKLEELKTFQNTHYKKQAQLIEILSLNELKRWDEAQKKFVVFCEQYNLAITNPYLGVKALKMKNPDKAFNLSYFIPGAGQMYAGQVSKGLLSMFLNASLVAFSGYSFWNGYYFSGAFTGVTLFSIFYNGGARYAEYMAQEYNKKKAIDFNSNVRNVLLEAAQ